MIRTGKEPMTVRPKRRIQPRPVPPALAQALLVQPQQQQRTLTIEQQCRNIRERIRLLHIETDRLIGRTRPRC